MKITMTLSRYSLPQRLTLDALDAMLDFLRHSPWESGFPDPEKSDYYTEVKLLRQEDMNAPCVLAVAGRVKAGKSTIINALLDSTEDLAKVGVEATTATINSFYHISHGNPDDPGKPIKCIYRDGRSEWVSQDFLDSLQGNDEKTFQKTIEIAELQFFLDNPILREITLVDTPGTEADEQTQQTTEKFLLELQEANIAVSRQRVSKAHAVLYVTGQVVLDTNNQFLDDFNTAFAGNAPRAYNSIGVMARIDSNLEVLEARHRLAASASVKLKDQVNTVVPVSAGLHRALRDNEKTRHFQVLREKLLIIDPKMRAFLLKADNVWSDPGITGVAVDTEERIRLKRNYPWGVFALISREILKLTDDEPLDIAIERLKDMSGFDRLGKLIREHFFERGLLIRYYGILARLRAICEEIRFVGTTYYRKQYRANKENMKDFCDFIASHPARNNAVADRLRDFLNDHIAIETPEFWEAKREEVGAIIDAAISQLEYVNMCFSGQQLLADHLQDFKPEEIDELRKLFGHHAGQEELPEKFFVQCQTKWRAVGHSTATNSECQKIALLAAECCGTVLGRFTK